MPSNTAWAVPFVESASFVAVVALYVGPFGSNVESGSLDCACGVAYGAIDLDLVGICSSFGGVVRGAQDHAFTGAILWIGLLPDLV